MPKLQSALVGAGLALALLLSATAPSAADPAGDAIGAGIAGGMLGFMTGAAVAGSGPHYYTYDHGDYGDYYGRPYSWRRHVRACFRAYGEDYDPESNTFVGDDGYEHHCRL